MADSGELVIHVQPIDDDPGELVELTGWLQSELLDVDAVESLPDEDVPEHSKGIGVLAGRLVVNLA